MRRFSKRSSRSRSSRKTYWQGSIATLSGIPFFTNAITLSNTWWSGWAVWPAGDFNDPDAPFPFPQPADTTVVRTIIEGSNFLNNGAAGNPINPVDVCVGIIAFDGGRNPGLWSDATGATDAPIAPPCPISDPGEDWLIRIPTCFVANKISNYEKTILFQESKAKRKLPPGHGLLFVMEVFSPFDSTEQEIFAQFDMRYALRSGYNASMR